MPCLSGRFDPIQGIFINMAVAKPGAEFRGGVPGTGSSGDRILNY